MSQIKDWAIVAFILILIFGSPFLPWAFSPNSEQWVSSIAQQGFQNIVLTETPWYTILTSCSSDAYAQRFDAEISGRKVSAVACKSVGKGVSIRS